MLEEQMTEINMRMFLFYITYYKFLRNFTFSSSIIVLRTSEIFRVYSNSSNYHRTKRTSDRYLRFSAAIPPFYSPWVMIARNYIKIPWIFRRDTTTSAIDVDVGGRKKERRRKRQRIRSGTISLPCVAGRFDSICTRCNRSAATVRANFIDPYLRSFTDIGRFNARSRPKTPGKAKTSFPARCADFPRDRCSPRQCDL